MRRRSVPEAANGGMGSYQMAMTRLAPTSPLPPLRPSNAFLLSRRILLLLQLIIDFTVSPLLSLETLSRDRLRVPC